MWPAEFELLLEQERQRNKDLECQVSESRAVSEKMREQQTKMQVEANSHAKEKRQWHQRAASTHRQIRIKTMLLKWPKSPIRTHTNAVKKLQSLPEVLRRHVQQHMQLKQQLCASVIERQKTAAATAQTIKAFQDRLHISERNEATSLTFNTDSPTFLQLPESALTCVDYQERKLVQLRLKLYLHTQTCPSSNNEDIQQPINKQWHCAQLECATMKKVLGHMESCTGGMDCTVPLCSSTRQVIEHWTSCADDECVVCQPVKRTFIVHTEILSKTLEALNESMDVADSSLDNSSLVIASPGKCRLLSVANHARRTIRLPGTTVESDAESDVGA